MMKKRTIQEEKVVKENEMRNEEIMKNLLRNDILTYSFLPLDL